MATLDNLKKERFARLLASGEVPKSAYIKAGYSERGAAANAYKLRQKPEVIARVEEIIAGRLREGGVNPANAGEAREEHVPGEWDWDGEVPISYIRKRLAEMHDQALRDGEFADALSALKLLGQSVGMFQAGANRQLLPTKPVGRPRMPDAPDAPAKGKSHDHSRTQVNVQVINRVTGAMGGKSGDDAADGPGNTIDAIATVVHALPNNGPEPFDGCGGGDEGEGGAGVPVEAGGSSSE
jgi:hypothetical protein